MSSDMHHDSTLEAGLLRKQQQEEEKSQLSARGFGDLTPGIPDTCPGQQESRKMSPLRRFLVIALIGLVALMGLAAAGGSCRGAMQHRAVQLDKRQAPGSNTTTSPTNTDQGNEGNQQTTGGVTQTISNAVTETVVTTETVHQPTSVDNPTGSSSTSTSEPGSSPPASSPPSSSAPPPSPPSSTPSSPATPSNPTTSVPTSQAPPASTPTASPSTPAPVPSSAEPTTSSPETTPRRTITTGTVTTSSAVQETITRTNGDGGVEIITSTSWVEIRPSSTDKADPSLQNVANSRGAGGVAAAAVAGIVAGAMML
ncbi:hypothetical protein BBO_05347 [Beauveria brongniartii RCEF 3172]|uniref:Uncharacterized protein n=1 Tax=Beauveria brongniartii RCEF 3172 TaxID=1081107 RepID=A0A162JBD0_9HYPO|nr:hypothetical protein BBO_05347 [Beauveria brongniartii RCEF 3172]